MRNKFSLYLISGSEQFLIQEARTQIVTTFVKEHTSDMDVAIHDMAETPIQEALADAETLPFLADKRVVIIKNPQFLTTQSEQKMDHDLNRLFTYIQNPSPYSIVIFEAPYDKLDTRKKIVKALQNNAKMISAAPLKDQELIDWLFRRAKQLNMNVERLALEKLVHLIGTNLRQLQTELEKLALYVREDGYVTEELISLLVARSLEDNVFALIDHVVNRRFEQAFRTLYDLLKQNEEPIKIVSLLARQFRIIQQVNELVRSGFTQKQIASMLKLHPYVVKLARGQGRHFSTATCLRMIKELANADYKMKSGQMDKQLALELFLSKLSQTVQK